MHRRALAGLALALTACTGSPVGDPCIPESIPAGGFDAQEVYLETSSVQCRTRVCMVYRLQGNPELVCEECGDCPGCLPRATVSAVTASSIAPDAPSRWPIIDLVEETASFLAWAPKVLLIAVVSIASLYGVEVPWALM